MPFSKTFVPYGGYWSSPFCRWQGSIGHLHAMELAADTARTALGLRDIQPEAFDRLLLGITVVQRRCFYGAPWMAGMIGAPGIGGPMISQACATSARLVASAALEVESGFHRCSLTVACDRTSNGPHVYYPNPKGVGGRGVAEDPVWDNFNQDPLTREAMIATAEHVAAEEGITREEQDAVALLRHGQYKNALADDRAFQRRYMVPIELRRGSRVVGRVEGDEGIHPTTAEGLARLRPVVKDGGTVTFGAQTHPADGNAGLIVCGQEEAGRLSANPAITVRILSYGEARVAPARMPKAVVPAARQALERAGRSPAECTAIKTHNPFAVNDIYLCRELGWKAEDINNFGSPLIWGHPQAPTGLRAVIELIEELVDRGGGLGLFTGCAAGDTAMALVLEVSG